MQQGSAAIQRTHGLRRVTNGIQYPPCSKMLRKDWPAISLGRCLLVRAHRTKRHACPAGLQQCWLGRAAFGGEGPFDVPEEELNEEQIERLQEQLFDTGRAIAA